jgi:hypothetical protein
MIVVPSTVYQQLSENGRKWQKMAENGIANNQKKKSVWPVSACVSENCASKPR